MLERERVANHLGDLGALGNDAALAFGLAQFSRLREDWQRLSGEAFGHRLMMDAVVPGRRRRRSDHARCATRSGASATTVERDVRRLRQIYDEHAGLAGPLHDHRPRHARTGRAARADRHGRPRQRPGHRPALRPRLAALPAAAGAHRDATRAATWRRAWRCASTKLFESLRLIRELCAGLPAGDIALRAPASRGPQPRGAGWVEGWRGEVLVALELGADGRIARCHCHDPSWQNWPVLEHAVIGNIVPDFPLINKSFNLSYSGHDL